MILILDASVFALASGVQSGADFSAAVEKLLVLKDLSDSKLTKTYADPKFPLALYENGNFPFFDTLQNLAALYPGGIATDTKTLNRYILELADKVLDLRELSECKGLEVAEYQFDPTFAEHLHPDICYSSAASMSYYAVAKSKLMPWTNSARFFTGWTTNPVNVSFEAQIDLIDPPIGDPPSEVLAVNVTMRCVRTASDVFQAEAPEEMWNSDIPVESMMLAVAARANHFRIANGQAPKRWTSEDFAFGNDFISSLKKHGGIGAGEASANVYDKCAKILAEVTMPNCNPFMTAAGGSLQRTRKSDGASAFRCHVTSRHEGLRLMFWKLKSGSIEFANIGPKFEHVIKE